jgi:hypothetical protein
MIRAISAAAGVDPAAALAEIGQRAQGRRRPGHGAEEMRTRERLALLKPDVTNMAKDHSSSS